MLNVWSGRRGWTLTRYRDRISLTRDGMAWEFVGTSADQLSVSAQLFGGTLRITGSGLTFRGLARRSVPELRAAIDAVVARGHVLPAITIAVQRRAAFETLLATHMSEQRWIAHDTAARTVSGLPRIAAVLSGLTTERRQLLHQELTSDERDALAFLDLDHAAVVSTTNAEISRREMTSCRDFFERIEKSPLTQEQAGAVVALDNRVRVVAAAGSGKTSVMVARAAYAIARGFVAPERILMLAFNADAAHELRQRVQSRLGALGVPSVGVQASTFHSFGLLLIGRATGRKPRVATWVESGQEETKLDEIVNGLRESQPDFRFAWDAFRLLYGRMSAEPDGGDPDSYDRSERRGGFRTFRGETVRSEGERLIADWLFLHGVNYDYERPYSVDVADSLHSQYRPDFFYPDVQVWHEHWALGHDGAPPESFTGYAESMQWKRQLHQQHGTTLVETSWHEIVNLTGFEKLAQDLKSHGLQLEWNPDRPIAGEKPLEHARLVRLMRTFMSHVKSGSLSRADLDARVQQRPGRGGARTRLFLDLYWKVHDRWEAELRAADAVDFDDMLLQAADVLEREPALVNFDLVMVDEFQDTSRARARLTRALTRGRDKYLLAVGDDWQAINRFAGADLTVMTDFDSFFGPSLTHRLQTTFRCSQSIADVASRFVSRNPAQIAKSVTSVHAGRGPAVTIVRVTNPEAIPQAITDHFAQLSQNAPGSSVDVLGRYGFEKQFLPRRQFPQLDITFRTVHKAKGLEADYVVLPNLTDGSHGFPSQISDDPVLALAMSQSDDYPHSEERRLLYVALTRAREGVMIVTVAGRESPFVMELLKDPDVVVDLKGAEPVRVCPGCGKGSLVRRKGPYGGFLGCSTFPACRQIVKR